MKHFKHIQNGKKLSRLTDTYSYYSLVTVKWQAV